MVVQTLKCRIRLGRLCFPKHAGIRTVKLDPFTYLKMGDDRLYQEAATIRFVAAHTSIPVPKVREVRTWNGVTYMMMKVAQGEQLPCYWAKMPSSVQQKVVSQLRDYLKQLRALTPPQPGCVSSVDGGPVEDLTRLGFAPSGPFSSHDAFHRFLRYGFGLETFTSSGEWKDAPSTLWMRQIVSSHSMNYSTVLTHGDFAPRNIHVREDGIVTCIVDWEMSGWFPEYWEYTKAHLTPHANDDWVRCIGIMTGEYEVQLKGESALQECCPDPATYAMSHPSSD